MKRSMKTDEDGWKADGILTGGRLPLALVIVGAKRPSRSHLQLYIFWHFSMGKFTRTMLLQEERETPSFCQRGYGNCLHLMMNFLPFLYVYVYARQMMFAFLHA